jgi:E3 ubiquitin-protein ligase TRIP12
VATPNQAAAAANAGSSSSGIPRTSSYAGAVKTAPVDWHLEFSMDGKQLSLDDTIYGAVHKHQQASQASSSLGGFYGMPVTFKFRKIDGPASSSESQWTVL